MYICINWIRYHEQKLQSRWNIWIVYWIVPFLSQLVGCYLPGMISTSKASLGVNLGTREERPGNTAAATADWAAGDPCCLKWRRSDLDISSPWGSMGFNHVQATKLIKLGEHITKHMAMMITCRKHRTENPCIWMYLNENTWLSFKCSLQPIGSNKNLPTSAHILTLSHYMSLLVNLDHSWAWWKSHIIS